MKKRTLFFIALILLAASNAFAKRAPAPEVPAIIHNGYEYTANYESGIISGRAYIKIQSVENPNDTKEITVYQTFFNLLEEVDVQWVFIKKTELINDETIQITNERDKVFTLNLKSLTVTQRR